MTICDRCGEEIEGPAYMNPSNVLENLCRFCYLQVKKDINSTDRKQKRREYLKMMTDPKIWANYPALSIMKKGEMTEHGILLADRRPIVYLENGYRLDGHKGKIVKFVQKHMKPITYPTFEAILDDGWEVSPEDMKSILGRLII